MAKNKKEIKELADLPYYREEYTAQLEKMGITDLPELLAALKDSKKKAKIVDELEGVGVKIADHWIEVLEDVPEESTAVATKGSKTEIIEEADAPSQFFRVTGFVDPPARRVSPSFVFRSARGHLRPNRVLHPQTNQLP